MKKLLLLSLLTIISLFSLNQIYADNLVLDEITMTSTDEAISVSEALNYAHGSIVHVEGIYIDTTHKHSWLIIQDVEGHEGLGIKLTEEEVTQFENVEPGNKITVLGMMDRYTSWGNNTRQLSNEVTQTANDQQQHEYTIIDNMSLEEISQSFHPFTEGEETLNPGHYDPGTLKVFTVNDVTFEEVDEHGERAIVGSFSNDVMMEEETFNFVYIMEQTDIEGLSELTYTPHQLVTELTFLFYYNQYGNWLIQPLEATLKELIIELHGDAYIELEQYAIYEEEGITATDIDGTNLDVIITGEVNTDIPGTYTIDYEVLDDLGESLHIETRTIEVLGENYPELELIGDEVMTIDINTIFDDPGATAINSDGDEYTVTTHGTVQTDEAGTYTIEYSATANDGTVIGPITRTVIVESPDAPVFTAPDTIIKNADYIAPTDFYLDYIYAEDFEENDITNNLEIIEDEYTGNANIPGEYNIVFRVSDQYNTSARHTITIEVKGGILPLLIIDETQFVVSYVYQLTDQDFIDTLKSIGILNNETFVFTDVYDNYTTNFNAEGTYAKEFHLLSESGTDHNHDITISVIDDDAEFIEADPGIVTNILSFIQTWWIAIGIMALVFIGLKARR